MAKRYFRYLGPHDSIDIDDDGTMKRFANVSGVPVPPGQHPETFGAVQVSDEVAALIEAPNWMPGHKFEDIGAAFKEVLAEERAEARQAREEQKAADEEAREAQRAAEERARQQQKAAKS